MTSPRVRPRVAGPSVALLRGINVGGRNKAAMVDLIECFLGAGHGGIRTHLPSGNVLFSTDPDDHGELEASLERALRERFGFPIPVVVRSRDEFSAVLASAPEEFGSDTLRSDVYFLKHPLTVDDAWALLPELREGVDTIARGPGVLYFSRVAALAGKTRIQKLMAMPIFQQMTVRGWNTVTRIDQMLRDG
jgi:uncharacterized protein (DUF1697 family)